jgi:hypothetical protein
MWHERGWDDRVGCIAGTWRLRLREVMVEKCAPLLDHQMPSFFLAKLSRKPAAGISIDNQKSPVDSPAALARPHELASVERAVTTSTYNHDIAECDFIGGSVHHQPPEPVR